jgi:hypothetical protein
MKYLPTGWPAQLLKSIVASDRRHAVIASCHPPLFHAQERPSRKGPSGRRGYEGDLCEGNEVVTPCHPPGAVGCDQLADHAHGRAAREARKVNRRLGVPCTPAAPVAPDRTHECARTRTQRRTHTRTHRCAHARAHARAHTHAHTGALASARTHAHTADMSTCARTRNCRDSNRPTCFQGFAPMPGIPKRHGIPRRHHIPRRHSIS